MPDAVRGTSGVRNLPQSYTMQPPKRPTIEITVAAVQLAVEMQRLQLPFRSGSLIVRRQAGQILRDIRNGAAELSERTFRKEESSLQSFYSPMEYFGLKPRSPASFEKKMGKSIVAYKIVGAKRELLHEAAGIASLLEARLAEDGTLPVDEVTSGMVADLAGKAKELRDAAMKASGVLRLRNISMDRR